MGELTQLCVRMVSNHHQPSGSLCYIETLESIKYYGVYNVSLNWKLENSAINRLLNVELLTPKLHQKAGEISNWTAMLK